MRCRRGVQTFRPSKQARPESHSRHAHTTAMPFYPEGIQRSGRARSQHQAKPPPARPARPRLSLLRLSRTETGHNPPSMVPSRPQPHPASQHNRHGRETAERGRRDAGSGSFDQEESPGQDPGKPATIHPPLMHNIAQKQYTCRSVALAVQHTRPCARRREKEHAAAGTQHTHSLC